MIVRIKHIFIAAFTAVFASAFCLALCITAFAANKVTEIDMDVMLRPDGSALVAQTWNGDFREGTECYFPVTNLGDMTLSDLQVSDENGPYTITEPWDAEASFEEKSGKCGLNPVDGGYEICWGISNYGHNQYSVEYTLGGLVGGYEDADGFLFQFIPDGMNTGPSEVTVRIVTPDGTFLSEENAGIWAFGFEGQIEFSDGDAVAYTLKPVSGDDSVTIMLMMNKGVLTPGRTVGGTFENVRRHAFEGSDYDSPDSAGGNKEEMETPGNTESSMLNIIIGTACILGAAALFWIKSLKHRLNWLYKDAAYCRETPIGGNLEASFVLADRFLQTRGESNLIAAALTRLMTAGCLVPEQEREAGGMGREKKSIALRLVKPPGRASTHGLAANQLYDLLVQAAGSDGVLQERELESYCKANHAALLNIVREAVGDGGETLEGIGCYTSDGRLSALSNLTDRGRILLLQLLGYKKYLQDFSLIAERGVEDALVWQNCLTYAVLLGIGEHVLKELRKFYSGADANIRMAESTYYIACRYNRITYRTAKNAEAAARRSLGGGGLSSLGGGSGFSGGGSGGGTR